MTIEHTHEDHDVADDFDDHRHVGWGDLDDHDHRGDDGAAFYFDCLACMANYEDEP